MMSPDRNDREVMNFLFVLSILFYSNTLETEKTLQFGNKKFSRLNVRYHVDGMNKRVYKMR